MKITLIIIWFFSHTHTHIFSYRFKLQIGQRYIISLALYCPLLLFMWNNGHVHTSVWLRNAAHVCRQTTHMHTHTTKIELKEIGFPFSPPFSQHIGFGTLLQISDKLASKHLCVYDIQCLQNRIKLFIYFFLLHFALLTLMRFLNWPWHLKMLLDGHSRKDNREWKNSASCFAQALQTCSIF